MSAFAVRPAAARAPRYPSREDFSSEELRHRPYRSGVSRALAAGLTALAGSSAMAQGWGMGLNPNSRMALAGDVAVSPQPMIAELIDPATADQLINRLFEEAGFDLQPFMGMAKDRPAITRWDARHHVGLVMLSEESLRSEKLWAQVLAHALSNSRIEGDPRPPEWGVCHTLTPKDEALVMSLVFPEENPSPLLILDPGDLLVQETYPGMPADPAAQVAARAAALQRLEGQVWEFLEYLSSQGIGG